MANTKTYTVVKDGSPIKELKSLAAAKKLADAEGAEVFCDGECVYSGTEMVPEISAPMRYRLKALMNVRKEPSIRSEKLGQKSAGSDVSVLELANDWLRLEDGGYILFEGGKFAEKL